MQHLIVPFCRKKNQPEPHSPFCVTRLPPPEHTANYALKLWWLTTCQLHVKSGCSLKLLELLATLCTENDTRDHMGFPVWRRWYGAPYYSRVPCVNGIFHSAGKGEGGGGGGIGLAIHRISSVCLCSVCWWIILRERATFNKLHSCDRLKIESRRAHDMQRLEVREHVMGSVFGNANKRGRGEKKKKSTL